MVTLLRGSGAMANLRELYLDQNNITDAGMMSLSEVIGNGALANCQRLDIYNNQISDAGMSAFAEALRSGALALVVLCVVTSLTA